MNNPICDDILIVEDNPSDAELTLSAFNKLGLSESIFIAEDGEEALDYIFCRGKHCLRNPACRIKAVLLDLNLPKINGLDVLLQIKTNEITKRIPVVIISSSNEDSDKTTAYQRGVNSYVVKPVEYDDYISTLKDVVKYWIKVNESLL